MLTGSLLTLGSRTFMAIAKVIATVFVVRGFGPSGQGMYAVALNVSVIAALMGSAGLEIANAYEIGRRPQLGRTLVLQSVAISVVTGIVIGTALWAAFPVIDVFEGFDQGYRPLLAMSPTFTVLMILLSGIALGGSAFLLLAGANIVLYATLLGGALVALTVNAPLLPFASWLVGNLAGSLLLGVALWRMLPGELQLRGTGLVSRLRFSGSVYFANLMNWLNFRLDLIIVAALLDPARAGAYAVSATLAEGLLYLGKSVAQPLLARAAGGTRRWDREHLRPYRLVIGATAAGSIVLILVAPSLVQFLYGPELRGAVVPLIILAAAMPAVAFTTLATSHLFGMGIARPTVLAVGVATIVAVVLDLIFVPRFGIAAAAGASLLAYGGAALILAAQIRRRLVIAPRWADLFLPAGDDAAAVRRLLDRWRKRTSAA